MPAAAAALSARCFYEVLGVEPTATASELKAAYRRAAKATHPDLNPQHADAAGDGDAAFKLVARAYEVLSDASQRAHYDHSRRSPGGPSGLDDFAATWAWRSQCAPAAARGCEGAAR